jgi:hypothetical protein
MFLNDSFFDLRIVSTSAAVVACACIYLGIAAAVSALTHTKNGSESSSRGSINAQKWWTKLAIDDVILLATSDWIANISLSRIQSS